MKQKYRILTLVLILIFVGIAILLRISVHPIFPQQCSQIYRYYAKTDGIHASFVKGYQVNDTLFVDVTLLQAQDSQSWAMLTNDFKIMPPAPYLQEKIKNKEDYIASKLIPKDQIPRQATEDNKEKDILAISHVTQSLTIFHLTRKEDIHAILYRNFELSTN